MTKQNLGSEFWIDVMVPDPDLLSTNEELIVSSGDVDFGDSHHEAISLKLIQLKSKQIYETKLTHGDCEKITRDFPPISVSSFVNMIVDGLNYHQSTEESDYDTPSKVAVTWEFVTGSSSSEGLARTEESNNSLMDLKLSVALVQDNPYFRQICFDIILPAKDMGAVEKAELQIVELSQLVDEQAKTIKAMQEKMKEKNIEIKKLSQLGNEQAKTIGTMQQSIKDEDEKLTATNDRIDEHQDKMIEKLKENTKTVNQRIDQIAKTLELEANKPPPLYLSAYKDEVVDLGTSCSPQDILNLVIPAGCKGRFLVATSTSVYNSSGHGYAYFGLARNGTIVKPKAGYLYLHSIYTFESQSFPVTYQMEVELSGDEEEGARTFSLRLEPNHGYSVGAVGSCLSVTEIPI